MAILASVAISFPETGLAQDEAATSEVAAAESADTSTTETESSATGDSSGDAPDDAGVGSVDATGYEDIGYTLEERISAVSHKVFVRAGRFELAPMLGASINDAFFLRTMLGGRASWHVWEHLSLEAGVNINLYPIPLQSVRGNFAQPGIDDVFALYGLADVGVNFAPFYGKFAAMSEWAVHFDTFVTAGLAGMLDGSGRNFWSNAPANPADAIMDHPWIIGARTNQPVPVYSPSPTPAVQLGFGGRIFVTKWMAIRAEVKNYFYPNLGYGFPRRTSQLPVQHYAMAQVGVGFYLPTTFEYEYEGARVVEQ